MMKENKHLRIACCDWMYEFIEQLDSERIDVLDLNKFYDYGMLQISPFRLYHDVENCGWRIIFNGYKIFHATDTHTLDGISAKDYDLYAIEHNYDEEIVEQAIAESYETGIYCRAIMSIESHLSYQQAQAFFESQAKKRSEILRLHESATYGYRYD